VRPIPPEKLEAARHRREQKLDQALALVGNEEKSFSALLAARSHYYSDECHHEDHGHCPLACPICERDCRCSCHKL
jgi:hypothetical protein